MCSMKFADKLHASIERSGSVICAGFDPRLDKIPTCFMDEAASSTSTNEDALYKVLTDFYGLVLEAIGDQIAAVKPNIAFYEQFGLGGIRAYLSLCDMVRERGIALVLDAKRGDIGATSAAYGNAFIGSVKAFGETVKTFNGDAVTVHPYHGFDSIEPFVEICEEHGKGIFILVKTSNPGSVDTQCTEDKDGVTLCDRIANWIDEQGERLIGDCGLSGLGAVVGATFPAEAKAMRKIMPKSYFLIPGMGAQGGSAEEAVSGFTQQGSGGIVNLSRGLTGSFSYATVTREKAHAELVGLATKFNEELRPAIEAV